MNTSESRGFKKEDFKSFAVSLLLFTFFGVLVTIPLLVILLIFSLVIASSLLNMKDWSGEGAIVLTGCVAPFVFLPIGYFMWLYSLKLTGLLKVWRKKTIRLSAIIPICFGVISAFTIWLIYWR